MAYVEPSRRPSDGRYGDNPNRTQQFHQFQVILKPSPIDIQDLYLQSLLALGTKPEDHDVRFVEDDWESPTLGAWGLGWQVWLDGLEISQSSPTFSRSAASGLQAGERRAHLWPRAHLHVSAERRGVVLGHAGRRACPARSSSSAAREWSTYNFEQADTQAHFAAFDHAEKECKRLLTLRRGPTKEAGPAGLRFRGEGGARVQRARRPRGHRRDGASALHRARARDG